MNSISRVLCFVCCVSLFSLGLQAQGRFKKFEESNIMHRADSLRIDSLKRAVADSIAVARRLAFEPVLRAMRGKVEGSYNFWLYTPAGYNRADSLAATTPLVIFLHGKSLCGKDLEKVRRYGSIDAVERGREIPAIVLAPQNPGEWWNPDKLCKILDYLKVEYPYDTTRVYVLGMSLGGYGTLDFVAARPERVAAAVALCGGTTAKDIGNMGEVPLWIIHGTADKLVSVKASQVIVKELEGRHLAHRLRYEWLIGASHSYLARYFYMPKIYQWLLSHSLKDEKRPVNRDVHISKEDQSTVYSGWGKKPYIKTIR